MSLLTGTACLTLLAAPSFAQSVTCMAMSCSTDSNISTTASSDGSAGTSSSDHDDAGSDGGAGGNAGGVTAWVGANTSITMAGSGSIGISAVSTGGADGRGAYQSANVGQGRTGGNGGTAGPVLVTSYPTISTKSENAFGIYAAAIGGTGGELIASTDPLPTVAMVVHGGSISCSGAGAVGIWASAQGGDAEADSDDHFHNPGRQCRRRRGGRRR